MSRSKELFSEARRVIPGGVNSPVRHYDPYPFFARRASAGHIWDADGRMYVDCCNGYGALLLGHGRREIVSAVSRELGRGTLYCVPTEAETALVRSIQKNFGSMRQMRLVNTGSEATMTAVRLARGYSKKSKIIKFEGCYHGAHDSMLVGAGSGFAHTGVPVSDGVPRDVAKNTIVARYNDTEGFKRAVRRNTGVAGVIIEPVMANAGLVVPREGFLESVREITRARDIPLIFDETVTGLRISPGGAQEYYGVVPDITTLGKALGGGFAIAAVGGRRDIMRQLAPAGAVYEASTFAGNPVSVAAAAASLRAINAAGGAMYRKLEKRCRVIVREIGDMAGERGIPHQINSVSSMYQVFFTGKPVLDYSGAKKSDASRFQRVFRRLLQREVFIAPSQFETVFLSNAHTDYDVEKIINGYSYALRAAMR